MAQKVLYALDCNDQQDTAEEDLRVAKKRLCQAQQQMSHEAESLLAVAEKLAVIALN